MNAYNYFLRFILLLLMPSLIISSPKFIQESSFPCTCSTPPPAPVPAKAITSAATGKSPAVKAKAPGAKATSAGVDGSAPEASKASASEPSASNQVRYPFSLP